MLVHKIQDALMALKGDDNMLTVSIRIGAKNYLNETLKMIVDQTRSSPNGRERMVAIIGEETMQLIEQL